MKSNHTDMRCIGGSVARFRSGYVCWNGLWILLFLIGIGLFCMGMPKYNDDYWYMWYLRPWFDAQGVLIPEDGGNVFRAGIPWTGIWETWNWHYLHDNARLGNFLAPMLLIFPKWVGSGLVTVMMGNIVFMSFRFAGVDWRRSALVPLAIFAWTFGLPWRDHLGVLDYQLNYVFSTWLALLLLGYIQRTKPHVKAWTDLLLGFILGFATGLSHEIVGVPVTAGLFMLVIFSKKDRNKRTAVVLSGLIAGIVVLATCPGMWERLETTHFKDRTPWFRIFNLRDSVPFAMLVVLVLWTAVRRRIRPVFRWNMALFYGSAILMSLFMIYICFFPGRIWFFINVLVIIVFMRLVCLNWNQWFSRYQWWSTSVAILMLGCAYCHLATVDYYSFVFRQSQRRQIAEYLRTRKSFVFGEVLTMNELSPVAGYMPDEGFHVKGLLYVPQYYEKCMKKSTSELAGIPRELRAVTDLSGEAMAGGPVRRKDGYYFARRECVPERDEGRGVMFRMDFGNGYMPIYAFVVYFTSEKDGKEYCWIAPYLNWSLFHFSEIRSIQIID